MFRCSECKKEYEIKPDYCDDCGNDIFEEIIIEQNKSQKEIEKETKNNIPNIEKIESTTEEEQIKSAKKDFNTEDIISFGVFLICVILSFFVIFFINPKEKPKEEVAQKPVEKAQDIPSLDSFWNNAKPKPAQTQIQSPQKAEQQIITSNNEPKTTEIKQAEIKPIIKPAKQEPKTTKVDLKYYPKSNTNIQPKKVEVKPSTTKQIQTKTVQNSAKNTTQKVAQTTKPTQKPNTTNTIQPQTKPQNIQVQTTTKPQTVQTQNITQKPQTQTTQVQTVQIVQTVNTQALKKELTSYKASLRNTIGKKIDFANVVGDGSCTIAFKIDSNGKLTNRSFSKQSTNITLNDAVYKAVMQTPSYNPPPSAYNGETLYLKISFYNGNFEVTLN